MDWTVSSYPKDTIYTHKWTIEDFEKAMYRNNGKIDSPSFTMPGLKQKFFFRIKKSECDKRMKDNDGDDRALPKGRHAKREDMVVDGVQSQISYLFDVWLLVKDPSDDSIMLTLAGTLEVSQGTTEIISKGHFIHIPIEEGFGPYFAESSGSEFASIDSDSDGWQFAKERFKSFKWGTQLYLDPWDELPCGDFYALDHTPDVTLKATIKIPSNMVHSSGVVNGAAERVPLKHLLNQPEFSDVTLKVGGREFACHRVILANKSPWFKRALTSGMVEDRTGVVEVVEFEAETMEKLLEFVYSGEKPEDMGDQLESVFKAAEYYEVMDLFEICIDLFGKEEVTPSNAVDIIEIANRHPQASKLKKRVFAWIKAERQKYMEDEIFTREMRRCPELMAELDVEAEWDLADI